MNQYWKEEYDVEYSHKDSKNHPEGPSKIEQDAAFLFGWCIL